VENGDLPAGEITNGLASKEIKLSSKGLDFGKGDAVCSL
jgi:hypothetical protein